MIERLDREKWESLYRILLKDPLRNYFNLLGIVGSKDIFREIYAQKEGNDIKYLFFLRKSGTLKLYPIEKYNINEVSIFIKDLDFKHIISPESYCEELCKTGVILKESVEGYLAQLKVRMIFSVGNDLDIRSLETYDIEKIEEIYTKTFRSYAPKNIIESRLLTGRGRAFGLFINNRMVAVAQTEFEDNSKAIIVGVATDPEYQNRGYSFELMKFLCNILISEGKEIYLEYENEIAGKLYAKLGFVIIDSMCKYKKVGDNNDPQNRD